MEDEALGSAEAGEGTDPPNPSAPPYVPEAVPPTMEEVRAARVRLGNAVLTSPVLRWRGPEIESLVGRQTEIFLKLELMQPSGSFKVRGALTVGLNLDEEERARGLVAVSAGNHALATAYAAKVLGVSAKVVMLATANAMAIETCKNYGAEVVMAGDGAAAFDEARRIEEEEGRAFVHPWEGPYTTLGTATIGLELAEQVPDLDAVIVAIGGGGLCSGLAPTIKALQPKVRVLTVEPKGADSMTKSFVAGKPETLERVTTVAGGLAPPYSLPYSFSLCRQYVDELVLISDQDMFDAMGILYREVKLAVEPSGAATTAALLGPYREQLRGKRVGLIVCGSNMGGEEFAGYLAQALPYE